ncbi:MAG: hypothetical protein BWY10_02527 [Chloroflexi bacterium ADurb.Bin180]|nr:MAG: hypothetical protein BWY10_02527 [Chloroflexi bacterium ADurb.Bin180]
MTVKTGAAWSGVIVCLDSTGALSTPSVGPVGALYVDGTVNAASVTVTGSNPYKWTVTLPSLTAGQRVSMYITATIATIATAAVVAEESADTVLVSDVKTDTAAILADTGTDGVVVADFTTAAKALIEAEVDDSLGSGTGTSLTAIPWNAAWDAEVQSECTDALNAYDPPTDTEMDAGFDALPTAAENADAVWDELISGHTTTGSMADELSDVDEDVWGYTTRTLTASAAATTSTVSGSSITATRGDTLTASLTALGNISSRSKLWFTVKEETEDADSASIVQIEETLGLLYINGAAAGTAANGSITVTDATTGALTITLKPAETDDLAVGQYKYDIQQLTSGGVVTTLTSGIFEVVADITKAVA